MSIKEGVEQLAQNPKMAAVISTGTVTVGTLLDWVPDDIGKLATVVGILLSGVLIRVHLLGLKKVKLEVAALEREAAKH